MTPFEYPDAYDIIVVGAGHAGCEASLAAARMGARVLVLTGSLEMVAQMSCNPVIGGVAKGHLVKEIDALGGEMALAADANGIQFRRLNTSKGPAVRSTRSQADKRRYRNWMRARLEVQPGLDAKQAEVEALLTSRADARTVYEERAHRLERSLEAARAERAEREAALAQAVDGLLEADRDALAGVVAEPQQLVDLQARAGGRWRGCGHRAAVVAAALQRANLRNARVCVSRLAHPVSQLDFHAVIRWFNSWR